MSFEWAFLAVDCASDSVLAMSDSTNSFSAFISYASPDKEKAIEIAESLEARGLKCWIAPQNVRPGHEYGDEIIRGIVNSRCLILVLSEAANESVFVRREVERAVSKRKPVFPIRIEDVLPSPSLELFVSATHWIDAWSDDSVSIIDQFARTLVGQEIDKSDEIAFKAGQSLRKRRWQFQSKWFWGAGAFVGLVFAVVVANLISGVFDSKGPSSTDHELRVPSKPGTTHNYVEDVVKMSGVDISALTSNDFKVSARVNSFASRPEVHVKGADNLISLLPVAQLYYGLNDKPPDQKSPSPMIELANLGPSALDVRKITIEYRFPDGRKIGPFSYPVNVPGAVRAFYKNIAERQEKWVRCVQLTCSFEPIGSFLPAVNSIELRESSGEKKKLISLNQVPDHNLFRHSYEGELPKPVFYPGSKSVTAVLTFYDGTVSKPRAADTRLRTGTAGLVKLQVVDTSANRDAPEVYATVESQVGIHWSFLLDPPPGFNNVYYTLDNGGFFKAKSARGNYAYSKNAYDLGSPTDGNTLRLKFRDASGAERGPFAYKIAWSSILTKNFEENFKRRVESHITCRYFKKDTGSSAFSSAMRATDVANSDWWFASRAPESAIACGARNDMGWVTVKEVRLGRAPDQLNTVTPVRVGPDDLISGRWNGRRAIWGGAKPFAIWYALLTGPPGDVYAVYVFRDGTKSDLARIKTIAR